MTFSQRRVLVTGGADDSQRQGAVRPDLTLCFEGERRNVALDPTRPVSDLAGTLPPRLVDLLEISLAVYCADLAFVRGQNEDWVRSTRFDLPVRDPEFWRSAEPALARLLFALTRDGYVFDFRPRAAAEAPSGEGTGTGHEADCVALLSGGLDSFAGATALLAAGRRVAFVGHRPHNATVAAAQEHVRECLARRFGEGVRFAAVPCGPGRFGEGSHDFPGPEERETSQRARSFLYLSLGAAACHLTGARELVCAENGLLALNLPLTEARVGGQSTAGTRPQTLAAFTDLAAALGLQIVVANPFTYQTKGQLLRDVLRRHFTADEIQGAVSCWMAGRQSRPCGGCVPCIVRAVSMHFADLPPEAYARDPLGTGGLSGPETAARANLVDLITFVRRFSALTDGELMRAYPALLDMVPEVSPSAAIGVLRRFAAEARAALAGSEAGEG